MASSPSTEAADIRRRGRHRLIGAIAIVAVLVIFVPMVFDSEPRAPQPEPSLEIPAKEKAPPLPAPSAPAKAVAPAESVTPAPDNGARGQAPAGARSTANAGAVAPAQAGVQLPKLEGFAVQVGAFRDEEKLKQARAKLSAAGVAHYIERRDTATGELTRLRAGPFATREAADKALGAVKAASLDGQVVPLP